jgi:hypothetical protein
VGEYPLLMARIVNRVVNPATVSIQLANGVRNPPSRVDSILGGWIFAYF